MEYLKSFTIGTSGIVSYSLLSYLTSQKKESYKYSLEKYALAIPIYYGCMTMLSTYIGKEYESFRQKMIKDNQEISKHLPILSLQGQLLLTSLLSIILITTFSYYINRYKHYNKIHHPFILEIDSVRELLVFNIIIFYFITNFSKNELLRYFIIGSSIFSYIYSYTYIIRNIHLINYKFTNFTMTEPFVQGLGWTIGIYILHKKLGIELLQTLLIYQVIATIVMGTVGYRMKLYKYKGIEWINRYLGPMFINGFIKVFPIYYLLTNLK